MIKLQNFAPKLRAYSREDVHGITWDMEAIAVDFISLAKAGGMEEEEFLRNLHRTWADVTIEVYIPKEELH